MSIVALLYHKIANDSGAMDDPYRITVGRDRFEAQMEALAASPYRVIPLADALVEPERFRSSPERHVALTFDDGYRTACEISLEVLGRLGLPATFFVSPGHVGQERLYWWDRLWRHQRALEEGSNPGPEARSRFSALCEDLMRLPYAEAERRVAEQAGGEPPPPAGDPDLPAGWELLRSLSGNPLFTIGCHGYHHDCFAALSIPSLREDLRRAVGRFSEEGIPALRALACPYGFSGCVQADQIREAVSLFFEWNLLSVRSLLWEPAPRDPFLLGRWYAEDEGAEDFLRRLDNAFTGREAA